MSTKMSLKVHTVSIFIKKLWYLDKILDIGHSDRYLWLLFKTWVQVGLTQKSSGLYKRSPNWQMSSFKSNNCSRTNKSMYFIPISWNIFHTFVSLKSFLSKSGFVKSGKTFQSNNFSVSTTHSLSRINMSLVRFIWFVKLLKDRT